MSEEMTLFPGLDATATRKKGRDETYRDYDSFVAKFYREAPKTTDDCYTPEEVYELVRSWTVANAEINIDNARVLRPFYPGGDYQAADYSGDCVVIDNPPFSLISQIVRWYEDRRIKYMLFAPSLTLFSISAGTATTYIISGGLVRYDNGAEVRTSFVSNLWPSTKVWCAGGLTLQLNAITARLREQDKPSLPKYVYPDQVLIAGRILKDANNGAEYRISPHETHPISRLASQSPHGKAIFGRGFLASRQAAERAAAERAAAERVIIWELSPSEQEIINRLSSR